MQIKNQFDWVSIICSGMSVRIFKVTRVICCMVNFIVHLLINSVSVKIANFKITLNGLIYSLVVHIVLNLVMLNKLRCHTYKFSAIQIA